MIMGNMPIRERQLLFIDDVVPESSLGCGYPRQIETITTIQAMPGVSVALYPTIDLIYPANEVGAVRDWLGEYPLEVVVTDELEEHLIAKAKKGKSYDAVVISRPHNYDFFIKVIKKHLPFVPIIYDAEALFYRRMERQLELIPENDRPLLEHETKKMRRIEEKIAREADELVFVSEEEAEILRPLARGRITVNTPLLASMDWTPKGFDERSGVAFVAGWAAGPKSPNIDGMQWFAREVWPRVLARLPEEKLSVTGANPQLEVRRFRCDSIEFLGRVDDLIEFYGNVRVVVVPNRFGAGVKNKTIEALQCGVPVVATTVGAEGVPVPGIVGTGPEAKETDPPPYLSVLDDPTLFAKRIVSLLTNREAWQEARRLLSQQCEAWEDSRRERTWTTIIDRVVPPVEALSDD